MQKDIKGKSPGMANGWGCVHQTAGCGEAETETPA